MTDYIVIATWPFGRTAAQAAVELLRQGVSALDAAIAGAQAVEDDPSVNSVGYGGLPNSVGTISLDACVMDGRTLACGAVAAVENIRHVSALARRVMDKTPHLMLAGEGARLFAIEQGFPLENLNTAESFIEWKKRKAQEKRSEIHIPGELAPAPAESFSHDTVAVLALDNKGELGGVCSTSGLAHKLPGRVGDSPIVGAGLYVDGTAGAAGATGVGEEILRICGSSLIVEAMRAGRSPQEACESAVRRINLVAVHRGLPPARVAFIALDPTGRTGAACTTPTDFEYAVGQAGKVELYKARTLDGNDL